MVNTKPLAHFNIPLFLVVLALDAIGLVNLYSAVHQEGIRSLEPLFMTQVIFVALGLVGSVLITLVDYRVFEKTAYMLYAGNVILLAGVLLFGREISGSKRWIHIAGFSFQPSEPCKLFLVMALAKYFHEHVRVGGYGLRHLVRPGLIALPSLILIYLSPDLGTTGFLILLFLLVSLCAQLKFRSIILIGIIGLLALPILYEFGLSDYQRDRIITLIDPTHDPRGKGYQTLQARYAIGAGKMFGSGYMKGMQTHQGFIPENQTDFIVTVLAEEWGFVGAMVLLGLYYLFMVLGLRIAVQARERFGALLAAGIVALFFLQIVINLGAVLGLAPVTGVTLPLMSYGGSSILLLHACVGLLNSISMRRYMF